MKNIIELKDICFRYPKESHQVISGFELSLKENEVLAILGPSGKGKSTILHVIAGFLTPEKGVITCNNEVLFDQQTNIAPEKRQMGMVFQDHCLFPHLTIEKNICFGYRPHDYSPADYLDMIKLPHKKNAYPHELSGGEQQRVSLARALASNPNVLLMDEPFSALNDALRIPLRNEVARHLKSLKIPAVIVTHSKEEAEEFADRIIEL